jgi:hypothetical protein
MNSPKRRKDEPTKSASFRQIKRKKLQEPPYLTYQFTEKETTALDTVFAHLFERLTEENTSTTN